MKKNLYRALDVDPAAAPDDIRRAYRRKAKKAHPDGGGTAESFAEIETAKRILIDPQRRAQYDKTGEYEEKPVDLRATAIRTRIALAISSALASCEAEGADPAQLDFVDVAKRVLCGGISEFRKKRDKAEKARVRIERVGRRFARRSRGEANVMEEVIAGMLVEATRPVREMDDELEMLSAALEVVSDHSFRIDAPTVAT